jgi:hypothetical protein
LALIEHVTVEELELLLAMDRAEEDTTTSLATGSRSVFLDKVSPDVRCSTSFVILFGWLALRHHHGGRCAL